MIFLFQFFIIVLALCVVGLLLISLAAFWESVRANKNGGGNHSENSRSVGCIARSALSYAIGA
jgi:hypothetical protein